MAHKTAELAGEVTDDMRVKLGQAIVHDSLMTNTDYLKRLIKRSSDIKFYADSCKQTIKALLTGGLSNCYGMSSELSDLISTIETLLLDVRDGERRIDLAIRYNGDDTLEDLKLALEYYDAVLKGTIQAISRIEDIDKRLDDCN